jgi:hypothetical protein
VLRRRARGSCLETDRAGPDWFGGTRDPTVGGVGVGVWWVGAFAIPCVWWVGTVAPIRALDVTDVHCLVVCPISFGVAGTVIWARVHEKGGAPRSTPKAPALHTRVVQRSTAVPTYYLNKLIILTYGIPKYCHYQNCAQVKSC